MKAKCQRCGCVEDLACWNKDGKEHHVCADCYGDLDASEERARAVGWRRREDAKQNSNA